MPEPAPPTAGVPVPTAEQVQQYLQDFPPLQPQRGMSWLAPLALGALLLTAMLLNTPLVWLLPWTGMLVLLAVAGQRIRQQRILEQKLLSCQELALLRRWPEALATAWILLPQVQKQPQMHGRTLAVLATTLEQMRAHDAALAAYAELIPRLPDDHPASVQLRLQRVLGLLAGGQLSDADGTLRSLRGAVQNYPNTLLPASFFLAELAQQTATNHFQDSTAHADQALERLRPLGLDAGYGYALIALAYERLAQQQQTLENNLIERQAGPADEATAQTPPVEDHDRAAGLRMRACQWWSRATLLIPPLVLAGRFPALADLVRLPHFQHAQIRLHPQEPQA